MLSPETHSPAEALAFWKSKNVVMDDEFKALSSSARARAFSVAGLTRRDQIADVATAIESALQNGETLADFKKNIGDLLEQKGWTGKRAWRVENIFRTNVQSAYSAGRYAQMKRVAKSRPYWKLVAVRDRRTRKTHLAVDGLIFPHDHPFWDTWYPPNGFACRCVVVSLSARQVKARGLTVQTEIPDRVQVVDSETGMESFVTPIPDQGWAANVGKDYQAGLSPSEFDGAFTPKNSRALCRCGDYADDPCRPSLSQLNRRHVLRVDPAKDLLPKAMSKSDQVLAFLQEFGVSGLDDSTLHIIPGGYPLTISKNLFVDKHTGRLKGSWGDKGQYMKLMARTIQNPFEVWWQPTKIGPNKRTVYALRMLRLFALPGKDVGGYCSFSLMGRKWHGATAFMPKAGRSQKAVLDYLEKQRGGVLVYREQLK